MRLFKSLLVGAVTAAVVIVLWVLISLFRAFHMQSGDGSGGIGALVIMDYQLYLAAILGFALGFFRTYLR